jgi:CheY-like chemotaxis protein
VQPNLKNVARPDLRLLSRPAEPTEEVRRGQRAHPSSRPVVRGPALYISGDREGRIRFAQIARRWKGIRLLVVEGGRNGLQVAMDHRLRLVVLDDRLPDVDGADLVKHLRHEVLGGETPIIVLAHDADPRQRARFLWAGASAYHSKPLNVAEIDQTVMVLMEIAALR